MMAQQALSEPLVVAGRQDVAAGGGPFALGRLTIGVFLVGQQTHRLALGCDRRRHIPLEAEDGWILPEGADGICEFDAPHSYLTVAFDAKFLIDAGMDLNQSFRPHVGRIDPLLGHLARLTVALQAEGPSIYRQTMELALAAHLNRMAMRAPDVTVTDDRRLRRVFSLIHDELDANLSIDQMASVAAMSRFHFARSFKRATGKSPLQYVIDARMEQAGLLLRTSNSTVAEIAYRVGYEDLSRFGQHFKKRTGLTPKLYRQR